MEGRMTVCNMSIEGGARIGYVNPDQKTYDYIKNREYAPKGDAFNARQVYWESIKSGSDAEYDDIVYFDAADLKPMVTWGVTPAQSVAVDEPLPSLENLSDSERELLETAYRHMKFRAGEKIIDKDIDVVFLGSCTNSRLSDLQAAATILKGQTIKQGLKMIVVPGSQQVKKEAEELGLDKIFIAAGAEWRSPGCSMCLAMNPDKLIGDELCVSTSNRNFIGRQGSSTGRTLLVGPEMAAVAAIKGKITDVREFMNV
jgi:3-isopropylmalate/(R)-2-methylmalate dehydratase large subunit